MSAGADICAISGTPPGDGCVGEVILRDVFSFFKPGTFALYTADALGYRSERCPDLPSFPHRNQVPRIGPCRRRWPGKLGAMQSYIHTRRALDPYAGTLAQEALDLAHSSGARKLWVVLNTPLLIALAGELCHLSDLPLYALVWDPPAYLCRQGCYDRWSIRHMLQHFGSALRRSRKVGVVSQGMRSAYEGAYGVPCVITRHGVSAGEAQPLHEVSVPPAPVRIGFAGGLYAFDAWYAFLAALDSTGWELAGRPVSLRILSSDMHIRARARAHVEILGWRPNDETCRLLSECDLLYLPQPFTDGLVDLASLSFPTKLSTYLATGRPVFAHAPSYASLGVFFGTETRPPGVCCTSLDPAVLRGALTALLCDKLAYAGAGAGAAELARTEFSRATSRSRFAESLDAVELLA